MKKGQVSFEVLFLFLIIMTGSIYITGMYLTTHEDTLIYTIARTDLVEQSNQIKGTAIIEKLDFTRASSGNTLKVSTTPQNLKATDFNLDQTREKIFSSTNLENLTILINN